MRLSILGLAALMLAGLIPGAAAQQTPPVAGRWLVEDRKGVIEIYPCADKICGKLAWLSEPNNDDGKPKLDRNNPDPALRQQPLCGLTMLHNFRQVEPNRWGEGLIYNPENGKTYHATMTLDGNLLKLRGYVGIPLFGETQTWTRADPKLKSC
jgi:uncharacterized protein (DUF2147 family)